MVRSWPPQVGTGASAELSCEAPGSLGAGVAVTALPEPLTPWCQPVATPTARVPSHAPSTAHALEGFLRPSPQHPYPACRN